MIRLELTEQDLVEVDKVVREVASRFSSVEDPEFHRASQLHAHELPRRLRQALVDFRMSEPTGVFVVSGLPVHDGGLGPTPTDWRAARDSAKTLRHDIAFFLISCLLGEPIGWATQQDGRIMHDVFPMAGHKHDQIGWGSEELLVWHTEDAFHPLRTDYLALMCLRNPDGVETTAADIADVVIDDETRAALSQERYLILPDDSHRPENAGAGDAGVDPRVVELRRRSLERVDNALRSPEPVAVLFGSPDDPYLRLDPHYMKDVQGEEEQRALDTIGAAVDKAMGGVVLEPGDIVFIDNYRVVHGRKPFQARFDGTDRWLRRLNVTRDLRKSRHARLTAESRVIY
ncbi:guanitoxin biosynthesis L-enduracididine beta-hydroxylase GntD [Actinokineospora terrae]|uniref:Arginine beta-hydroxylase, Fe(II)/alpha-ketoglutarate-dependent n=1 Tax=Actinokineospora terrae TaxID=155974 RepID=A0A1H9XA83_9PSEU|nr:guanitoxin biosynthesis L-enduracididine beta-hydroxylase GntD [Actinokineospora terrae]SES42543.1 arginine beta-hydroxylase, Fe(II)/alpha-ketoglutarate-dependent [Actinokineospora terrae]